MSEEKIRKMINDFAYQVRSKTQDLKKSGSLSALLTTITNGGRAEFIEVEKAIGDQEQKLTNRMRDLENQLTKAKTQQTSGGTTSMNELISKLESLLKRIPNEEQPVSKALEDLNTNIEWAVFKPMDFSTWTDLKLPQELARGKSEVSDKSQTINDSITDSVSAMASFFQFLNTSVDKEFAGEYELFDDANEFITELRNSTDKYRNMRGYVPYIVLGFIVLLILGGPSLLVRLTWRRDREARRNKHALGLIRTTEGVIRMLDYNITRSRSAQVEVPLLQKITGSFSFSEQQQERSLTLPGLTAHYIKYIQEVQDVLEKVYGSRKLIICIDELDKINEPEQVGNVLREIKGALYVEDCFYLLSISEDAVRAFKSRFVEERDIFESTFDEIMFLERFDLETCEKVAFRRIAEMDRDIDESENNLDLTEATWIAAVVSTGVPREFLRNMRVIITEKHGVKELDATSAWHALFRRKLVETFEKVRAASGLEDLRAELIEEIERLISRTAGTAGEDASSLSPEIRFNMDTTCKEIINLKERLAVFAKKSEDLNRQRKQSDSKEHRAELDTRINLIETWQRNWLELLIYLYARKASLRLSGTPNFMKACKELLGIYGMLPYSFTRSKKLLVDHAEKATVMCDMSDGC
jgi:hypothetical protein